MVLKSLPFVGLGIALVAMLIVNISGLGYAGEHMVGGHTNKNVRPISEIISLNATSFSRYLTIPQEDEICANFQVELNVNKHILYEHDKLIIQGEAPSDAKLEARLIPLDGVTRGKMVNITLEGSHFEYPLHAYGSHDKQAKYAALITATKTVDGNTCLFGDYEIVEYKGTIEGSD